MGIAAPGAPEQHVDQQKKSAARGTAPASQIASRIEVALVVNSLQSGNR
jgi:hypothetical protein